MVTTRAPNTIRIESEPSLPLWRETFFGLDWLQLRLSPVYYGIGIPQGNGSPVVLVPGFLNNDRYLVELFNWLKRVGYKPYYSNIGRNADCLDILLGRILDTIDQAYSDTGQKPHLIGHSLGGTLARGAATLIPDQVGQIITLASPFRSVKAHPLLITASDFVRGGTIKRRKDNSEVSPDCYTDQCTCRAVQSIKDGLPDQVERLALYTPEDGVVDWRCCVEDNPDYNKQVSSTHAGIAFHPDSYSAIGNQLAENGKTIYRSA